MRIGKLQARDVNGKRVASYHCIKGSLMYAADWKRQQEALGHTVKFIKL